MFGVIPRDISDEVSEPGPSKIRKIISVAQEHDISAIGHKRSDTEKYNVLKSKQSFDKKFQFLQEQFGRKPNGKPHMHSFSISWWDEFGPDGLVYSTEQNAAYCK